MMASSDPWATCIEVPHIDWRLLFSMLATLSRNCSGIIVTSGSSRLRKCGNPRAASNSCSRKYRWTIRSKTFEFQRRVGIAHEAGEAWILRHIHVHIKVRKAALLRSLSMLKHRKQPPEAITPSQPCGRLLSRGGIFFAAASSFMNSVIDCCGACK